jgi:class 3 adenylate cyclase/pimeloyl-ACP methyl ester carboxylesterase
MATGEISRRLTTIVAADVAGYSRLTAADEAGTLAALRTHRSEFIDPKVAEYRGRIANTAGDSILIEFPSVANALRCAVDVQRGMAERNVSIPEDRRITFRLGVNLGDVVQQDEDLLGDGVNVAARLEAIAPPGSICVSEVVKDALGQEAGIQFEDLGPQRLKNVSKSIRAYLVTDAGGDSLGSAARYSLSDQSTVRYLLSSDGVSIAYADVGKGHPLVLMGGWMTHLEKDWESPIMRYFLTHLSKSFRLLRFDQRGNGMSDWTNVDMSFEKMVDDLECVVDSYDYEKVAIFATSQAASVSIAYAVRHPERVSHLVLHGGYARGRCHRGEPGAAAESEALVTLIRRRWGAENPAFRQYMTSLFMPDASGEEAIWFNEFQRTCGPGENMARFREMFDAIDISELLSQVRVPTLILHCTEDSVAPISEGKFLASRIPGAQFVMLKSKNHMIFENEPDFPKFVQSIRNFVN